MALPIVAASVIVTCCGLATAQDTVLSEMYGAGAHEYFAGRHFEAYQHLTDAINGGSKDPRVFYFRGFALMRMGRENEAREDFKAGAAIESTDISQFYPVGKALERVQGSARVALERTRSVARAEAYQKQQQQTAQRYEQRRRSEAAVLRRQPTRPAIAVNDDGVPVAPATRAAAAAPAMAGRC